MPYWLVLVLAFFLWMAGWALFYRYRLGRLNVIQREFEESVSAKHQGEDRYRWLQRHHHEFLELIRAANIQDSHIAYAEVVSPMHVSTGNASAMENWLALRADSIQWTRRAIEQARGVYEGRLVQSLNPLHWAVMVVTLPMQAVKWVGGNPDGSLSRAVTVLWWFLGAVALVAGLVGFNLLDLIGQP